MITTSSSVERLIDNINYLHLQIGKASSLLFPSPTSQFFPLLFWASSLAREGKKKTAKGMERNTQISFLSQPELHFLAMSLVHFLAVVAEAVVEGNAGLDLSNL